MWLELSERKKRSHASNQNESLRLWGQVVAGNGCLPLSEDAFLGLVEGSNWGCLNLEKVSIRDDQGSGQSGRQGLLPIV